MNIGMILYINSVYKTDKESPGNTLNMISIPAVHFTLDLFE